MLILPGSILYYEGRVAQYYGIPVPRGTRMTEGAVADSCEAAGMKAVCAGDCNCRYSSSRCEVDENHLDEDHNGGEGEESLVTEDGHTLVSENDL